MGATVLGRRASALLGGSAIGTEDEEGRDFLPFEGHCLDWAAEVDASTAGEVVGSWNGEADSCAE